ncbi:MarR family transcriptional regulator [Virgisporangium aliadipatigenens]|uniref:MarR family transcriptional regulator n=1 Tax=Virgisporangium aliadipatigenens TaxID=741659 RepID=A0A8J4DPV2_9ACTN|nr:MarR family transcriptional regulator [Virgisporangium aliadipatigenens]GIJ46360.1 MarR family transcriptional regulator [Virgisporangium aliadipatigenens]
MAPESDEHVETVERAMVALRRSQSRRALARLAADHRPTALSSGAEVLDAIEQAEEAQTPATVTSVAAALGIDQPRASKLVAAAVEAGLVRRVADQSDGRRALLVRTASGRRVSAEIHAFRRQVAGQAMDGWSARDRADFARLLSRFVAALSAVTADR